MTAKYAVLLPAIVIDSTNKGIRMTENATTATANLAESTYFCRGDGSSDDLLKAFDTAVEAATASVNTYTETMALSVDASAISAAITITRASGADAFGFLWADALTTFDEALLGRSAVNDTVNSSAKVNTLSPSSMWVSPEAYASFDPIEEYEAAASRALSGKVRGVRRGGPYESRQWVQENVDSRRLWDYDNTSDTNACLNKWLENWADGTRFEFHAVALGTYPALGALSSSTRIGTYQLDTEAMKRFAPTRIEPGLSLYDFTMLLMAYVA